MLEHQLQKAGIQLKTDFEAALPAVQGNAGKLQQVFLNLFLNARDAMSGGGTLEVRTWSEGAGVRAEVLDWATASLPNTSTGSMTRSSLPRRRGKAPGWDCR